VEVKGGERAAPPPAQTSGIDEAAFALAYAGPAVRKLARELNVDLGRVKGSGDKGRILKTDVEAFSKGAAPARAPAPATAPPAASAASICCRGPKSISPSSARSKPSRWRASRRSRQPICIATG